MRSSDCTDKGTSSRDRVTQETRLPGSAPTGTVTGVKCAYLCWCRTSSSRLRLSRLLAPLPCRPGLCAGSWKALRPPLEARLEQEGRHTWRASPLILFRPRSPLVLPFFLSCCRKAFSPGGRADDQDGQRVSSPRPARGLKTTGRQREGPSTNVKGQMDGLPSCHDYGYPLVTWLLLATAPPGAQVQVWGR